MTLTAIVALLQSAVLLLTLAQTAPNLPQSFRDNAMAVAQNAITQATTALASGATPSSSVPSAPATPTNPTPNTSSTAITQSLSLSLGQITTTLDSAYVTWSTNIPADSKIFVTPVAGAANSTRVLQSSAGRSTQGFINITGLTSGTQYSYEIEAIAGSQVKKLGGSFSTNVCTPSWSVHTDAEKDGLRKQTNAEFIVKIDQACGGSTLYEVLRADGVRAYLGGEKVISLYPNGSHTLIEGDVWKIYFIWNGDKKEIAIPIR